MRNDVAAIKEKALSGIFKDPNFYIGLSFFLIPLILNGIVYRKQKAAADKTDGAVGEIKKAADRAEKLNIETNETMEKLKRFAEKGAVVDDMITRNAQYQKAKDEVDRTMDVLRGVTKTPHSRRMVDIFPEMYEYIIQRIRNTQKLAIVTMPFYQFGLEGNPHGLHDFHHALYNMFRNTVQRDDIPHLVFVTYDDESRYAMARKRYGRSIHALHMLDNASQTNKLKDIFSEEVWRSVEMELEYFQEELSMYKGARSRLAMLAERQQEWWKRNLRIDEGAPFIREINDFIKHKKKIFGRIISDKEAMDLMFIKLLRAEGRKQDADIFSDFNDARNALGEAVEKQERIYFNPDMGWEGMGTPWPHGATIIRVPRDKVISRQWGEIPNIGFDNEMSVCIDGVEVMYADYSLNQGLDRYDAFRENRIVSESGELSLDYYKTNLSMVLEAGKGQMPFAVMQKVNEVLPGIPVIEHWLDSPEPEPQGPSEPQA